MRHQATREQMCLQRLECLRTQSRIKRVPPAALWWSLTPLKDATQVRPRDMPEALFSSLTDKWRWKLSRRAELPEKEAGGLCGRVCQSERTPRMANVKNYETLGHADQDPPAEVFYGPLRLRPVCAWRLTRPPSRKGQDSRKPWRRTCSMLVWGACCGISASRRDASLPISWLSAHPTRRLTIQMSRSTPCWTRQILLRQSTTNLLSQSFPLVGWTTSQSQSVWDRPSPDWGRSCQDCDNQCQSNCWICSWSCQDYREIIFCVHYLSAKILPNKKPPRERAESVMSVPRHHFSLGLVHALNFPVEWLAKRRQTTPPRVWQSGSLKRVWLKCCCRMDRASCCEMYCHWGNPFAPEQQHPHSFEPSLAIFSSSNPKCSRNKICMQQVLVMGGCLPTRALLPLSTSGQGYLLQRLHGEVLSSSLKKNSKSRQESPLSVSNCSVAPHGGSDHVACATIGVMCHAATRIISVEYVLVMLESLIPSRKSWSCHIRMWRTMPCFQLGQRSELRTEWSIMISTTS